MAIKILSTHVCPNCRIARKEWQIPGVDGKNIRRGGGIPTILMLRLSPGSGQSPIRVRDECPDCGEVMEGELVLDTPESGSPRLLDVKRPGARTVSRGQS